MSLYEYCGSEPVGWVDPLGLGILGWIKRLPRAVWEAIKAVTVPPAEAAKAAPDIAKIALRAKAQARMFECYKLGIEYETDPVWIRLRAGAAGRDALTPRQQKILEEYLKKLKLQKKKK